jgi:ADP-ribosyl-[dinitrogen reductase] hydrolase
MNKIKGGMFGVAIGDALGAPAEFKRRGTFKKITDFKYCDTFNLQPGEWTDDTAMTLCLAHSLIEKRGFDLKDQMEQYVKWFLEGFLSHNGKAIGIGRTILLSITLYVKTNEIYTSLISEDFSGNGSLMRILPVALFYSNDINKAVGYAGESSKNTHGSRIAVDGCRYFVYLLCKIIKGAKKEDLTTKEFIAETSLFFQNKPLHKEIKQIALCDFMSRSKESISSSGYIVHT